MRIYCMSDIHGCLAAFEEALALFKEHLEERDTRLLLLGDYIHGGEDSYGVLDKIMAMQQEYGCDKVIALMGNHEEFVLYGESTINHLIRNMCDYQKYSDERDEPYIRWIENLPRYYVEGNTIFVHAGIEEDAGDLWDWATGENVFTGKFPAQTGKIEGLDKKVVAGHIGTSDIAGDSSFHDIYYDGASHYYIDGTVLKSRRIPVLMVDTKTDRYYRVTESGIWPVQPYDMDDDEYDIWCKNLYR